MSGFEVEELIARPVSEVWARAIDFEKAPEWMVGIDSMKAVGDGDIGSGTQLEFEARGAKRESTIVEWSPEKKMTLQSTQGPVTATYVYTFEDVEGTTRVRLSAECVASGGPIRLVMPLISFMMKRVDGPQLGALKRVLEG